MILSQFLQFNSILSVHIVIIYGNNIIRDDHIANNHCRNTVQYVVEIKHIVDSTVWTILRETAAKSADETFVYKSVYVMIDKY